MNPILKRVLGGALIGALAFGAGAVAIAADAPAAGSTAKPAKATPPTTTADPADVVKYRHNQMEAIGKHMKLLHMITQGQVPYTDQAALHAQGMHDLVATIPALFPAGTGPDKVKSESKANIWAEWDKFLAAAALSEQDTAKLAEVAKGGDMAALKAQFDVTRKSCGDCHELFQVEDEH